MTSITHPVSCFDAFPIDRGPADERDAARSQPLGQLAERLERFRLMRLDDHADAFESESLPIYKCLN
jgi:hypothetical protein